MKPPPILFDWLNAAASPPSSPLSVDDAVGEGGGGYTTLDIPQRHPTSIRLKTQVTLGPHAMHDRLARNGVSCTVRLGATRWLQPHGNSVWINKGKNPSASPQI